MAAGNFAASMGWLARRYSKSGLPQQNCPFIWLCWSEEEHRQADIWQPAASLSQLELHNGILFPAAAILEALWLVVGDRQQAYILRFPGFPDSPY